MLIIAIKIGRCSSESISHQNIKDKKKKKKIEYVFVYSIWPLNAFYGIM